MRRSLAPSQISVQKSVVSSIDTSNLRRKHRNDHTKDDQVTICRLPLFGFLEIPEVLNKQFKIPSGCVITEQSIALRKIKSLGPQRSGSILRPGGFQNVFVKPLALQDGGGADDENEEEGLPTSSLPPFEPLVLWRDPNDETNKVEVIPQLASKLRPHQREGVQFLFECTMGLRGFEGQGCILADDMGLGKTLMSITLLWTLLNQGMTPGKSAVTKVMIVCPTSLVGNWDNEIRKWVGEHCPTFAVKTEPKKIIKQFVAHRGKGVLIVSYETQRLYSKLFETSGGSASKFTSTSLGTGSVCDLLICDEAHKLKNAESGLAKSLNALPARKRVLLSGTPMQNELTEFFNMVNFCNPLVLGTAAEFKKRYERPILSSREPDASDSEVAHATLLQKELSTIVNEFILKRGNILNAQHLPPKLVQFVCCRLTPLQEALYECCINSKEMRHVREGKQTNTLNSIRQLINICSHPNIVLEAYNAKVSAKEAVDDDLRALVDIIRKHNAENGGGGAKAIAAGNNQNNNTKNNALFGGRLHLSTRAGFGTSAVSSSSSSSSSSGQYIDPDQSGKMSALFRMIQTMRALKQGERIVVVSNYTQTLDLIEQMCAQNAWPVLRLDGTVSANKRTKLVDEFNAPGSGAFVFLLSSKAGGCGINLIGGSRLVLFDPDWNPASDKQAAARIWREGQKRRCFIYRFMSTGSIEEKIIQRQLSKEGLADIVDDKDQINVFSTAELRQLFELRKDTCSDTHDTLRCKRCSTVKSKDSGSGKKRLSPGQVEACAQFLSDFLRYVEAEAGMHRKRELRRLAESDAAVGGGTTSNSSTLEYYRTLSRDSTSSSAVVIEIPFSAEIEELRAQLLAGDFATLPLYSRRQREVMLAIDGVHNEAKSSGSSGVVAAKIGIISDGGALGEGTSNGDNTADALIAAEEAEEQRVMSVYRHLLPSTFSLYSEFIRLWAELVPTLTMLASSTTSASGGVESSLSANNSSGDLAGANKTTTAATTSGGSDDGTGNGEDGLPVAEFVEQEGCPEETDFNRWSHHASVNTCDDELLQRSLADEGDNIVSFVFGLEVNWSLLQAREEATREENEARKEQQRADLEALNRDRKRKRRRANGECSDSEEEEEEVEVDAGAAGVESVAGVDDVEGVQCQSDYTAPDQCGEFAPTDKARNSSDSNAKKAKKGGRVQDRDGDALLGMDSPSQPRTKEAPTKSKSSRGKMSSVVTVSAQGLEQQRQQRQIEMRRSEVVELWDDSTLHSSCEEEDDRHSTSRNKAVIHSRSDSRGDIDGDVRDQARQVEAVATLRLEPKRPAVSAVHINGKSTSDGVGSSKRRRVVADEDDEEGQEAQGVGRAAAAGYGNARPLPGPAAATTDKPIAVVATAASKGSRRVIPSDDDDDDDEVPPRHKTAASATISSSVDKENDSAPVALKTKASAGSATSSRVPLLPLQQNDNSANANVSNDNDEDVLFLLSSDCYSSPPTLPVAATDSQRDDQTTIPYAQYPVDKSDMKWVCDHCTYINDSSDGGSSALKCDMCDQRRPKSARAGSSKR